MKTVNRYFLFSMIGLIQCYFQTRVGDLIPHMVFGRKVEDYDFGGMYCAILEVNSIIVSAGIIRIFGEEMVEFPLVAISTGSQGQELQTGTGL